MDSSVEIFRLCRLCLVKDQVNVPIFDEEDARHVFLKISSCLPVKISENDELPKKICDGCSHKLDSFYEFWTSTVTAQETLLSWIAQKTQTPPTEPTVPKPIVNVKRETEALEESSKDETEEPSSKRPRRSASIKAQNNIIPESDDEDGDLDTTEIVTKEEIGELESSYTEMAGSSVDEAQPGPSGVGKDEVEPGLKESVKDDESDLEGFDVVDATIAEPNQKMTVRRLRGSKPQFVLYCPKCGQHCKNYNDYDKHILENPSHQSFDCFQCKKHVESLPDLKRHAEKAHPIEKFLASTQGGGYFCHFCGSKKMSIKKLDTHIQNDHVKWVLECTMCPRLYKNPQALYNHFEIVHAVINNVDFLCNQCNLHFYDPEIYTLHMNKYHKVELKSLTYQCVLCTSKLKEISDFLRHVHKHGNYTVSSEEMKNERPAFVVWSRQCFICSKVVENRAELKDHLLTEHFSNTICPLCNVKIKGTIELHLREVHSLSLDINLKCENDKRYIPFVISEPKNKRLANPATEKVCEVCYGLVPKKAFFQHKAMHKNRGTHQLKSQNPVVDTVPNQNQLSFCKTCRLRVVTTFMTWHKSIHKKHEKKPSGKRLRSRSPARPRKRSRERSRSWDRARLRAELKCTECDRSYDTVENLVNHIKAQHFAAPLQPSSYNPYMTGMVPIEFQAVGAAEPFGFQNPIPDVNTLSLGNFSQPRSSNRTGSSRARRDFRNRPKF